MPYLVKFEQLSLGKHELFFEVGKDLFKSSENQESEILDLNFQVDLSIYKTGNMMDMTFDFNGVFILLCDRCNEPMEVPSHSETKLAVKYGQAHHEDFDEMIVLEDHEHDFDLGPYFFETMSLMVPVRHVHEEKDCDPEVIKKLKEMNLGPEKDETDPRWDKLKSI